MTIGVQTLPACIRAAATRRRAGLALIPLIGAAGIALAYSFSSEPGQQAADVPAYVPAPARSVETPWSASTTANVQAGTRADPPVGQSAVPAPAKPRSDALAGNDAALGGAALEPLADEVMHITNVGDRIVVTRGAEGPRATATPEQSAGDSGSAAASHGSNESVDGNPDSAGAVEQRPDYEDVYPGCPRVLPQGADEKMALERQQLYGCLYYESCASPVNDEPPYCTWHLIKKL